VARSHSPARDPSALRWGAGERVDDRLHGAARIISAARACYESAGVAPTTIDAIAERAGVSRRTVYRYFDSKEAILLAVIEDQAEPFFEGMSKSLDQVDSGDFRQLLIHCVLYAIENGPDIDGHHLLLGKNNAAATEHFYLHSARMKNNFHDILAPVYEQSIQAGLLDATWRLDDLINWAGRLVYSFIRNPEPIDNINRMVSQFLLPSRFHPDQ